MRRIDTECLKCGALCEVITETGQGLPPCSAVAMPSDEDANYEHVEGAACGGELQIVWEDGGPSFEIR